MVSKKIIIRLPLGLHLRPASVLCNRSIDFEASVTVKAGDKIVNGKSVLGLLSAGIKYEDEIELSCDGSDEEDALDLLSQMIESGLGDEIL